MDLGKSPQMGAISFDKDELDTSAALFEGSGFDEEFDRFLKDLDAKQ
jgi:hypothetical protein